jgi:hypothetical protein
MRRWAALRQATCHHCHPEKVRTECAADRCGRCASQNDQPAAIDGGSSSSDSRPLQPRYLVRFDMKRNSA